MRHAHANFFHGSGRTFVQNRIQNHHQRFRALQRKAFLTNVARMQKHLERVGFHQCAQKRKLHLTRSGILVCSRLEAVPHPVADARVLDVHELGADGAGINFLEARDHRAQRRLLVVEEELG